ncbi:MAG TPA: protein kinase, partial [Myxococcaceae bacterium]|nr:protein kinase [Myxococcaceae bacterium]
MDELLEDESALSISMELLEGRTLKAALVSAGALTPLEVERVARASLAGLAAAHAAGVVHRDFKPQNVFLCNDRQVKLLDFGFARTNAAAGLTTRSVMVCTPDYAAPELIEGGPVDGRADLYGLGVAMYEALSGRLPYTGSSTYELLRRQISEPPPPLGSLRPDLPPRLCSVVHRLMAKSPADRFPTAEAVVDALDRSTDPPRAVAGVCSTCGEPRDPGWPMCPACGGEAGNVAGGDHLVLLTRAPGPAAIPALREVVRSVGATPRSALARADPAIARDVPQLLLKDVGEPVARLLRERCLSHDLQVEIRRISDGTADLLHRSSVPRWFFLLGLLLPWALLFSAGVIAYVRGGGGLTRILLLATLGLAGPAGASWALRNAHRLVPALATVPLTAEPSPIPVGLGARYRVVLTQLRDRGLQATVRRLLERTLTLHRSFREAPPSVQLLFDEPRQQAIDLTIRALDIAVDVQRRIDRLAAVDESRLLARLEELRARAAVEPEQAAVLREAIVGVEEACREAGDLDRTQALAMGQLLRISAALETTVARLDLATAPGETGVSRELCRLQEDVGF